MKKVNDVSICIYRYNVTARSTMCKSLFSYVYCTIDLNILYSKESYYLICECWTKMFALNNKANSEQPTRAPFWLRWLVCTWSIMSGLFVAATTVTSPSCSTPSSSVRSWASTRSATLLPPDELRETKQQNTLMF